MRHPLIYCSRSAETVRLGLQVRCVEFGNRDVSDAVREVPIHGQHPCQVGLEHPLHRLGTSARHECLTGRNRFAQDDFGERPRQKNLQ